MEQTGRVADPAPALTRGLRLLGLLAIEGQSSLEQLARKTAWPKSSVLRCLLALEAAGVVVRDPATKLWSALRVLAPAPADTLANGGAARRRLPVLADATAHCAELYRVAEGRVVLIDRAEPGDAPVTVNARVGFERDLAELDATAALAFAFGDLRPGRRLFRWRGADRVSVGSAARDRVLAAARRERLARDLDFNIHGIRRFAVPLLARGRLVGLIAVAQRQTPAAAGEVARIEEALRSALAAIGVES